MTWKRVVVTIVVMMVVKMEKMIVKFNLRKKIGIQKMNLMKVIVRVEMKAIQIVIWKMMMFMRMYLSEPL